MNPPAPYADAAHHAVEQAARTSYGRLVAWLAARWRDVAAAEDALSDAFAAALRTWPQTGVPEKPEAWLLAAAHRRLIDLARHHRVRADTAADLAAAFENTPASMPFPDERLPLLFVCAHPAIAEETRAPLMLQTVLGLDAARIAAAWLVAPSAMSQRLVRAKNKIRDAGIRFQLPESSELPERLDSVLEAIYAAYGTGWEDLIGADARNRDITREALWLARALAELLPGEPEALGLLSLLLHCEARRPSRRDSDGRYVPLSAQKPAAWVHPLINEAEATLSAAARLQRPARFQWLAAIQSAHARRARDGRTDWAAILTLYNALMNDAPTTGAAVARAAALGEVHGARHALDALSEIPADSVQRYQPYWALRADLLARLDRPDEAAFAYQQSIDLCTDPAVSAFLHERSRSNQTKRHG